MKKLFKNRYFSFLMIYLCVLSLIGTGLSFSRYTSNDSQENEARTAVYDVVISSGSLDSTEKNITMNIYATSKISEPASMQVGTYEKKQINIINRSECDVSLSDFEMVFPENSVYAKLIIPKSKEEMDAYEKQMGSMPLVILDYLGKTESELADAAQVYTLLKEKNEESFSFFTDGEILKTGEAKTFFIVSWVEHDAVYKADADANADTDNISHKTLEQLGIAAENFLIKINSRQVD